MEEGVLHIELVDGPLSRERQGEDGANGRRLHHGAECLIKVHTWSLSEPAQNPASLVPFQRTISLELVLEDPLPDDHIVMWRARNQIPGVIPQEGSMLFFHSRPPIGVGEGATEGLRDRGQWRRGEESRLPEAELRTGDHAMLVDDGDHRHGSLRQRRCAGDWRGRRRSLGTSRVDTVVGLHRRERTRCLARGRVRARCR